MSDEPVVTGWDNICAVLSDDGDSLCALAKGHDGPHGWEPVDLDVVFALPETPDALQYIMVPQAKYDELRAVLSALCDATAPITSIVYPAELHRLTSWEQFADARAAAVSVLQGDAP